jgi:hypothetical protein
MCVLLLIRSTNRAFWRSPSWRSVSHPCYCAVLRAECCICVCLLQISTGNYATTILKELRLTADANLGEIEEAARVVCGKDLQTLKRDRKGQLGDAVLAGRLASLIALVRVSWCVFERAILAGYDANLIYYCMNAAW